MACGSMLNSLHSLPTLWCLSSLGGSQTHVRRRNLGGSWVRESSLEHEVVLPVLGIAAFVRHLVLCRPAALYHFSSSSLKAERLRSQPYSPRLSPSKMPVGICCVPIFTFLNSFIATFGFTILFLIVCFVSLSFSASKHCSNVPFAAGELFGWK